MVGLSGYRIAVVDSAKVVFDSTSQQNVERVLRCSMPDEETLSSIVDKLDATIYWDDAELRGIRRSDSYKLYLLTDS